MKEEGVSLDKEFFPKTVDQLVEYASATSADTPEEFRRSAYLYYIARLMVALYEALLSKLPIQVWNEYRNSMDHFMRYITNPTDENKDHLSKMEGHIQRAVLDVCKYFCIGMKEKTDSTIRKDGMECLRLVDNGSFYENISVKKGHFNPLFPVGPYT